MNATPQAASTALIRVLLVDDDPFDHRMVVDLLDSIPHRRFNIQSARNLADGLEFLKTGRFDICLLDPRLPDGDGLDLLVSAAALGLILPMIIIAGLPSFDQDERALGLGAAAFLEKSKLDPTSLDRAIRYAIHQRKLAETRTQQAFLDDATGLISHGLFRHRLEQALAFARRRDQEVAVMMADLSPVPATAVDRHLMDAALAAAVRRLAGDLRETDSIARLSDQRIGLLIEGVGSLDETATVARKALRSLRETVDVEGGKVSLSPSLGVALYPREAGDGGTLMHRAEAAMRRALAEDGGVCRFSSDRVDYEAREGMVLEKAFGIAFERRDLRLGFWPEVHLKGRLTGLAADIFWHHPDQGWLPAARSLADTDDPLLIKGIVDWSLASAAEHILAWRRDDLALHRLSLAIPFRRRLALANLERAIDEQVAARQVAPACIELDLHEELVVDDARRGSADLAGLDATGVRLALDDFGEGNAAIQHLRHDLLDGLKLAPARCRGQQDGERDKRLARGLIGLGRHLDLEVTAKITDDRALVGRLKRAGCTAVRLSEALPSMSAEVATAWLRAVAARPEPGPTAQPLPQPETLVPGTRRRQDSDAGTPTPADRQP